MKVLFATTNPAKINKFYDKLNKNGIEVLTIKDLGINPNVNENGKNAIENAYIKAKAYYDATKIITIGMDNNLFIDGIPEEKQPGVYVRRVNGIELSDEEMIQYYTKLINQYGGKLMAKWVYGLVVYNGSECKEISWNKENFYLIDKVCQKRNPGYPLDSITIIPEYDKYLVELTNEEKKSRNNNDLDLVLEFIINNLKKWNNE